MNRLTKQGQKRSISEYLNLSIIPMVLLTVVITQSTWFFFIEQNTEIFDVAPLCSKLTPLFGQMSRVNPNIIILLNRLQYLTYRDILC